MKPWKITLIVIGVLLIIGIVVVFLSSSPKQATKPAVPYNPFADVASNPSETPDAYTTAFYSWYLQILATNQNFSSSPDFKTQISQWLAPTFVANWNSIVENTDQNPVLLSQDIQNSWASNIHTAVVNQTATDATVEVSLGTTGEQQLLLVHLIRTNGAWSITSIDPATPTN